MSRQHQTCCQFSGNCTTKMTSNSDSPTLRGLRTTLASARDLILPNLASNGEGNQTAPRCFSLVQEMRISISSSPLSQFPPNFQSYFPCKMNRNRLFFTKMWFTTLRVPPQSCGSDCGRNGAGFCFLVITAPGCMHPQGYTYSLIWKTFTLCSGSVWVEKSHSVRLFIWETVSYVRPLIHMCLRSRGALW